MNRMPRGLFVPPFCIYEDDIAYGDCVVVYLPGSDVYLTDKHDMIEFFVLGITDEITELEDTAVQIALKSTRAVYMYAVYQARKLRDGYFVEKRVTNIDTINPICDTDTQKALFLKIRDRQDDTEKRLDFIERMINGS